MSNEKTALKRDLGLISATSIVIGIVIGSGVFVKPGKVLAAVGGSSSLAILAWVFGGLMSIAGGLVVSELAARVPRTGGIYAYIEAIYGRFFGFLCGWVQTLIYGPALMSALSLYFAALACEFVGAGSGVEKPVAIGAMFLLAFVNALGTRYGGILQVVSTFGKLIPIALVAIAGTLMGTEPILTAGASSSVSGGSALLGMGAAILATLWAYDGWILVGNMAGEMRNPQRDLPRAILFGLGIVVIAYLGVNVALFHTLPAAQISELNAKAAGSAATVLFGSAGGKLISLGILVSIFGCLNGNILTAPRIPYAMAERREFLFHTSLSKLHPRFGTPIHALAFQVTVALLMIVGANSDWLTDIAIFSMYLFFTLAFIGIFLLRRKEPESQGFRVPLYPITPAIAVIGGLYIVVSTVVNQPGMTLYAGGVMASAIPAYFWLKAQRTPESPDESTAPVSKAS